MRHAVQLDPTGGRSGPHPTFPTPQGAGRPPRPAWGGRVLVFGAFVLVGATAPVAVPQVAHATVTSGVNASTLLVSSDAADPITITCVGGQVKVNAADPGTGPAACSSVTALEVVGGPGGNVIDLSGVDPGAFTALSDVEVDAREGDDTVLGTPLADVIIGGSDRDRIVAGRGGDFVLAGIADDVLVWNNGDGSDVMEGQAGADTVEVNGAVADADAFTVGPNGGRVRFDRTNLVPFTLDINETEALNVNGNGGNDTIEGAPGLASLIDLTFAGGDGDDTLIGGDGDDVLAGGVGNDRITGFRGSDQMLGEVGADLMVWNNGDGSDLIEGEAGTDTVQVNGAAVDADAFTVNPNGARVRFDRTNLVPFSLDIGTSENLAVNGNGGNDTITGAAGLAPLIRLGFSGGDGDDALTGGDGDDVLAGGIGNDRITGFRGSDQMLGETGEDRMIWNNGDGSDLIDGAAGTDVVEVNGADTDGDRFTVVPNGGRVRFDRINLVAFRLDIAGAELLDLESAGGDDTVVAAGGMKTLIDLAFTGGSGDDRLVGSNGDDLLRGGPGADRMFGAAGDDTLDGEGGEDRLDGGRGADRLDGAGARDQFAGGGGDDRIDARGQRLEPVDCGGGSDRARADRLDLVRRNCEVVRR